MAMNARPELSDDALRGFLRARSERAGTEGLLASVRSAAAVTAQRRPARLHLGFLQGPAAGAAGVAAIGVLAVVVALALGSKAPESPIGATASEAAPSSGPSAGPPATPVIPGAEEPVLPLTIDQVNAILLPNPGALQGRLLVIDATIAMNPAAVTRGPCCSAPAFAGPLVILQGSTPIIAIKIAAAASLPGPMPWTGIFAARMIDTRTMEFLEPVTRAPGGEPLKPSQLASLSSLTRASGYVLAQGWLAGFDVAIPCPAPLVTPPPGPQYDGCAVTSSLSDSSAQPVSGTTFRVPRDGVQVQDRAYDDFAPDPQLMSPFGTKPELATFLLDQAFPSCPSGIYCSLFAASPHWQIVARLDSWPVPGETAAPTGEPTPSPAQDQPVQPLTVAQLNAFMALNSQSPAQRPDLVITGTIQRNPPPTGHACIPLGATWSCPPAFLVGSSPKLMVEPVGDVGPGPWDQNGQAVSGPFLATLGEFTLHYEGPVATSDGTEPLLPSQLPPPSKEGATIGEWLVRGWISGVGIASPCPSTSIATANGFPEYACGGLTSFLIGDATQPVTVTPGGFSVKLPAGGIEIQDGGYDSFAPLPMVTGVKTEPEAGTFLLRALSIPDCGPNEDCAVVPTSYHWEIMARLDPWPVPALP